MSRTLLRVLGPLEVSLDDTPVELGSRKQRLVLAVLAALANRPVSSDLLIDQIWGETPPDRATHSLQTYVSNLRRLIGKDRIRRTSAGYVLHVEPDESDVAMFEGTVNGLDGRSDEETIERLTAALALWRTSVPFDGLVDDAPILQHEAARLTELELVAEEALLDAKLGLPRSTDLIPRLQVLTDRFPYRESLWGLLMKALQKEGRQVEALAAYRTIRTRLAEELGIDPSPALREIEYQVLTQSVPRRWTRPTRSTLPVPPSELVGRETELALGTTLVKAHRIVTITGPAGVGKTRVAIEVASRLTEEFPDGVFFVDLASVSVPADIPQAVATGLMLLDQSGRTPAEAVASRLRQGDLLLVLDNCEHLVEAVSSSTMTWTSANAGLHVLASSQVRLDLEGEHVLQLSPLSVPSEAAGASEAVELFVTLLRDQTPTLALTESDVEAVEHICERLDGLPLAIELAAARARSISLPEIAARLADRFAFLSAGKRSSLERHRSLRAAVEWSHSLLSGDEQRLFEALSVLAGRFTLESAEGLAERVTAPASFLEAFDVLIAGSLVERRNDGRSFYRMLETLREFGRMRLAERGELDTMERVRAEYFAGVARRAADRIRTPDYAETWRRIDEEIDDIRQAFRWSVGSGDLALAFDLSRVHWGLVFTGTRHHLREGSEWRRVLLESEPGEAMTARLLAEESFVAFLLGDQVEAVDLAERSRESVGGDPATETLALQVLALCAATNQDTDRAIAMAQRAIELGGDDKDAHGLEALAFAYIFGGRGPEAVAAAEQVLVRADEQEYPLRRIRALALLGAALQTVDVDRSLATLDEAVAATEELGMEWDLAGAVMARGGSRWMSGDVAGALDDLGRACELTYDVRDFRRLAQTLEALGGIVGSIGRAMEAIEVLSASESLRAAIGVTGSESEVVRRQRMRAHFGEQLTPYLRTKAEEWGVDVSAGEAARVGSAIAASVRGDLSDS